MRFSYGYWVMQEGVEPHYPAEAYDVETIPGGLRIYLPTQAVESRGTTLNQAMITLELTAPREGIIAVRAFHFAGVQRCAPCFEKFTDDLTPVCTVTHEQAVLQSGTLRAVVQRKPYKLSFYDGERFLTDSDWRNLAYLRREAPASNRDAGAPYMVEQLRISVGEKVYGLGERFTPFIKNGQSVDMWNEDGGTSSEIAYKNVPFYLTNRGYGVFVDHPERVFFEAGTEKVSRVSFGVPGEELRYAVIAGAPLTVMQRYTAYLGRPALPPAWSFGLWLTTSFVTSYDEATTDSFMDGMAKRGIPLHVFHYDCFWMREFNWCDFAWDERVFPDPRGMLARAHARGLRVCVWINPYIAQRSPLFAEGARMGYLLKRRKGDVFQWDIWQSGMALVDFSNPDAAAWYRGKLKALLDMGVDCFKTDFGERIPTNVSYFDGSDPEAMHNYYAHLYNQCVFELLQETRGAGEALVFARSATAGGQRFPAHWGGDCTATYESMAETLRGGLSLAQSGFAFWSHDISGFETTATPDIYKRWCAFGLLSTHSRLHGSKTYRVPWLFDEEACDVLRFFVRQKCRLMPYLYAQAALAHRCGLPVLRPMMMDFPEDPLCDGLDLQYMLGPSLLVAPVMNDQSIGACYLPAGAWTHLLSGEQVAGGRYLSARYDYFSLPLFVRENTLLPLGANEERPDYDYAQGLELRLFALQDGCTAACEVPNLRGDTVMRIQAKRAGRVVEIACDGAEALPPLTLVNVDVLHGVSGARAEKTPLGLRLLAEGCSLRAEL